MKELNEFLERLTTLALWDLANVFSILQAPPPLPPYHFPQLFYLGQQHYKFNFFFMYIFMYIKRSYSTLKHAETPPL